MVGQAIPTGASNYQLFIGRYNSNGTPDNTFGTSGKSNFRFYDPSGNGSTDYGGSILQLSNGDFIVSSFSGYLLEFTAAGGLVTTFGTKGIYSDSVQDISSVVTQGNDLLIGGQTPSHMNFVVSRLTSNGKLDSTFGTSGRVLFNASNLTNLTPSTDSEGVELSVRADGSFVFSGDVGNVRNGFIANFSSNGKPAAAFGQSTGQFLLGYPGDNSAYASLRPTALWL